ncbi:MAG: Protease HtpX-like protein [Candidatus Gottesmanbacteria bacterium GW2011_GWB1_43_11]|uniref:Protease HtpX homolog n=1 Tax=Candidatus Gottesmanbacteria bacterium GW2011_GWB1_43_11 TaxID=1618446 RepID=A0A0G1CKQ2_9BACT|nr:MAG: Protease HtpX-like protein [Candidatus Gottesmanbacteria bacterium GW2011_GWA2_42_16]KKS50881.1 MAG: Protease HtpX-like protein [Candidatus Gottesmanbacteria bacterium GW2011_GWA1_42_26]KKS82034.1 MAG: HtpX-2 peptidase, heat shock protein HtpX [Candidatus Gottesmanbacteria bacterium GW2011_GWC1_43_10]KKS86395.1 MAG: Protease HtpX-like protein [Candidatus Gottesmanbacteria bacterium GW2011_GWB1_43_11]
MAGFVAFFALIAWVMGEALGYGSGYVGVAVVLSLLTSVGSYFWGDQLILAMSGAREADRKRDFDLFTVTENLALAAGLPKPKLYVIDDTAMNAFATGRDPEHAIVVATTGILQRLDRRELEGVIAHELSHVKNYDIRLLLVVGVLVGTIAFVTDWFLRSLWWGGRRNREERSGGGAFMLIGIVLTILAPILATIIKLAISRQREYLADASGALITRYPEGLARALEKLAGDREVLEAATNATAHLYITNPFKDKNFGAWFAGLFDTHPPIEERIKRLRNM